MTTTTETESTLPPSTLTKQQYKSFGPKPLPEPYKSQFAPGAAIYAHVRYDDDCGNGHNTFAITGSIREPKQRDISSGGCIHEEIAAAFPELAPLIKWHLVSADGPMHYPGNVLYMAGERDCHGLLKGERRQIINGRTKLPHWDLVAVNAPGVQISNTPTGEGYKGADTLPLFILTKDAQAADESELPPVPVLRWVPCDRVGEGKERELDAARSCAVWPEATDEELSQPREQLEAVLMERLPALMDEFKTAMEAIGFTY